MKLSMTKRDITILLLIGIASTLSLYLKPSVATTDTAFQQPLDQRIPTSFGEWQAVPTNTISMDLYRKNDGERSTDNPYDDTLMRAYQNPKGDVVHLAIAYGKRQQQEVKVHRPELCYYAQGFNIDALTDRKLMLNGEAVDSKRMLVSIGDENRAVSYWIRIGHIYSNSAWQTRLYILQQGLLGKVPDGILVRASTVIKDPAKSDAEFKRNEAFISALISSLPLQHKTQLLTK